MAIFKQGALQIEVGQQFRRVGERFGIVWEVTRLWTATDGLLHARLTGVGTKGESRIISAMTLADPHFFTLVETSPSGR